MLRLRASFVATQYALSLSAGGQSTTQNVGTLLHIHTCTRSSSVRKGAACGAVLVTYALSARTFAGVASVDVRSARTVCMRVWWSGRWVDGWPVGGRTQRLRTCFGHRVPDAERQHPHVALDDRDVDAVDDVVVARVQPGGAGAGPVLVGGCGDCD